MRLGRLLSAEGALPRPEAPARSEGLQLSPAGLAQALLVVYAACLHAATTNVMSRLISYGRERSTVAYATAASRLSRAFDNALKTYYRLKRDNTQVIRTQKVEVQPG